MGKVLIIAEAGVNHNGSLKLAYQMVDAAKDAGADVIKFQTAKPEAVISKYAPKAEYQMETTSKSESQLEMIKRIHLKFEDYIPLKAYCEKRDIRFLSTPFDIESINFLNSLGMQIWKVPSGEVTNYPYLVEMAKTGKPVYMSTGMCTLDEIEEAVKVLKENGTDSISLLHCTTAYPTDYKDVNLNAMYTLKKRFGYPIGYSDHTLGSQIPIAAVAMGAQIIEKHFTLSRTMEGPDHKASLEPNELKKMVSDIRCVEAAMGSYEKKATQIEEKNKLIARKSIVANCNIKKGELFTENSITTKRPGTGISPMMWNDIVGTRASRDYMADELID